VAESGLAMETRLPQPFQLPALLARRLVIVCMNK
jgi:hypothetical protein